MNRRLIFKKADGNELDALALRKFWLLDAERRADVAKQTPYEAHYSSEDDDLKVVYVEDPIAECAYVIVSGSDFEKGCALIKESVEVWSAAEILAAWRGARHDSEMISAILRVGVAAPYDSDEEFARALSEALANQDPAVREAALVAIAYRDWPEFDPALERVKRDDSDERCRERARLMLEVRSCRSSDRLQSSSAGAS